MVNVIEQDGSKGRLMPDHDFEYEHAVEEGNKLIERAKFSESSIDEIHYWYAYAAEQLIRENQIPRRKIVGKLYQDFSQFYGERQIRRILKETRRIELPEDDVKKGQMSESDSSLYIEKDGKLVKVDNEFEIANAEYIEYMQNAHLLTENLLYMLRHEHFVQNIPKPVFHEFITYAKALLKNASDAIDKRYQFKTNRLHILVEKALLTTINEADHHYSKYVRDDAETTSKQIRRCIMGWVPDLPPIMEPANRNQAVYFGFSGTPCSSCKSYRTEKQYGVDKQGGDLMMTVKCFACGACSEPVLAILYKDPRARAVKIDGHGNVVTVRLGVDGSSSETESRGK